MCKEYIRRWCIDAVDMFIVVVPCDKLVLPGISMHKRVRRTLRRSLHIGICDTELRRTYNVHNNTLPIKYLSQERANMLDITFQDWKAKNNTRKVSFE